MPNTEPKYVRLKESEHKKNRCKGNKASTDLFQETNILDSTKKSKAKSPLRFQNVVKNAVNTTSMCASVMGYGLEMSQESKNEDDKTQLKVPHAARSIHHRLFQRRSSEDSVKPGVRYQYMNFGYQSE